MPSPSHDLTVIALSQPSPLFAAIVTAIQRIFSVVFAFRSPWFFVLLVVRESWSQRVESTRKTFFMSTRDDRKNGNWDLYIEVTFNSYFIGRARVYLLSSLRIVHCPTISLRSSEENRMRAQRKWQHRIEWTNPSHQVNKEKIYRCLSSLYPTTNGGS